MIKYAFSILNIILITAASFFGVKLFYQVVSGKLMESSLTAAIHLNKSMAGLPAQQDLTANKKKHDFSFYQAIINRDLFKANITKSDTADEQIQLDKLQKTQLNLDLYGTVSGDPNEAYAVIEETKTRKQKLYREGDSVDNALIKKILRNTVVLNVNGKDEILTVKNKKNNQQSRFASSPGRMGEMPEPEYMGPGSEAVNVNRNKVNSALRNINQLMRQVRIRPHFQNGRPNGLMLSHIQPNSIFKDMGLQSGDIVKGVNGNPIQSVDDALKFYENLKSSSSVNLQIERHGEQMNIDYQIQ